MRNICKGFTLVEMTVVVFLIGILATMGLSAANALLASSSISNTKKKQEVIREALITYLGTNKRLPCPSVNENGFEANNGAVPNICTGYFGLLPYRALNLPKSAALDGWENIFSYAVSPQWTLVYANTVTASSSNDPAISFNTGDAGALAVSARTPATNPVATPLGNDAVIVISHGNNGLGAFTNKGTQTNLPAAGTDELSNAVPAGFGLPATFYQREYTDTDIAVYGSFDDVLLRLSPTEILSPLIKDGSFKSPEAQWYEQVEKITNTIIGMMFEPNNTGTCAPPIDQLTLEVRLAASGIPNVDPWGNTISFNRNICRLNSNGSSRVYVGATCNFGTTTLSTGGYAFNLSTITPNKQINPPTIGQIIAKYPNFLDHCP